MDTSALVAIMKAEPDGDRLARALAEGDAAIGAPSVVETRLALSSILTAEDIDGYLRRLFVSTNLEVIDFTHEMADVATNAFFRFGKGRGHPAQLNFGDCMSYAVAKVLDVPLLFKGGDFARTDIRAALP